MWYFLCSWFQVCLNTLVPWCQNGGWWDTHRTIYNATGNFPASYVWVQSLPFDLEVRERFWGMMLLFWEKSIETNRCFISHHSLNLIPIILHLRLLVGGLEHEFYFSHHIGNVIIPTDELIFFRGVGQPPTRNVLYKYRDLVVGGAMELRLEFPKQSFPSGFGHWVPIFFNFSGMTWAWFKVDIPQGIHRFRMILVTWS